MKKLRDFLAVLATIPVLVFIVAEAIEAIKVLISNAPNAFDIATDWRVIVISLIVATCVVVIEILCSRKKD